MSVCSVLVQVGPRRIWMSFGTYYDAHTVAQLLSQGAEVDVEVWSGEIRTHIYRDGVQHSVAKVELVN